MADNVDIGLLAKLARENLSEIKAVRRDQADMRREQTDMRRQLTDVSTLAVQTAEFIRKMEQRLDARMVAVRDDLELMLKSELMGRLAHFETRIENLLHERLAIIEKTD
jgi:hypothetical protein